MGRYIGWKNLLVSVAGTSVLTMGCAEDLKPIGGVDETTTSGATDASTSMTSVPGTTGSTGEGSTGSGDAADTTAGDTGTTGGAGSTGTTSGDTDGATGATGDAETEGSGTGSAGTTGDAEGGSTGTPVDGDIQPDEIDNPSFDEWVPTGPPPSWTNAGDSDASYYSWGSSNSGEGRLAQWHTDPYTVETFQLVSPLPNGTYTFSIWATGGGGYDAQYLFARGYSADDPDAVMTISTDGINGMSYTQVELTGIPVTSGQVEIGVYSEASVGNLWTNFDDAALTAE